MIEQRVFYDRLENHCKLCPHWKGVCLKGHALASDEGCPLQKFPPVNGADYAPERTTAAPAPKIVDCCGADSRMPPLNWGQVLASFAKSMAEWIKAGLPLVSHKTHGMRYGSCKTCLQFHRFYCKHCKCVAYLKTKLATEQCPLDPPRWFSAIAPDE